MTRQQYILHCLPLLAAVLGNRYGIEVTFQGDEAMTNGRLIKLPVLPHDSGEDVVSMVRGYIDHESAHIRYTDFAAVKEANLDHVTKWLFNALEDWRVEREMSVLYPGCRQNMHWLAKWLFVEQNKLEAGAKAPASGLLRYVLLTARSWDVPDIAPVCQKLRDKISVLFPGVPDSIDAVLDEVRQNCRDTDSAIAYARKLSEILEKWAQDAPELSSDANSETTSTENSGCGEVAQTKFGKSEIEKLFADPNVNLPENIGQMLESELNNAAGRGVSNGCTIAEVCTNGLSPMSDSDRQNTLRSSTALRARIHGLMQTTTRKRMFIGRTGVLHSEKLYRTCIGNAKVFRSFTESKGVNTAVHILLDASSSMSGKAIRLANQACYAIAHVLSQIRNINPAITAFQGFREPQVTPMLRHGSRLQRFVCADACGNTPLAPALWWVLQQMVVLREDRKLILIISDGAPNSGDPYEDALQAARHMGVEVYGIGIQSSCMTDILPKTSCAIEKLPELSTALFKVLGSTLTREAA